MSAQTQLFPKREAVQLLKDRVQAWCAEENRRERERVRLKGDKASSGTRQVFTMAAVVLIYISDSGKMDSSPTKRAIMCLSSKLLNKASWKKLRLTYSYS